MYKSIIYKIFYSAMLVLFVTSCEDYLDVEPASLWDKDNFYSNPEEAEIAIAGIYAALAQEVYRTHLTGNYASGTDEGTYKSSNNDNWSVGLYTVTPADGPVRAVWLGLYKAINLANVLIESLDEEALGESYAAYIAEARFLRAHSYFILTSFWEHVPLRLKPVVDQSDNHVPPSELKSVYDQIVDDFKFASEFLPAVNDESYIKGRAHKTAAMGLLTRVYLKMSGYPLKEDHYADAKEYCDKVIDSGMHSLELGDDNENGYTLVFKDLIGSVYNTKEVLFEISYSYLREQGNIRADGQIGAMNGISWEFMNNVDGLPGGNATFHAYPSLEVLYRSDEDPAEEVIDSVRYNWNIATYKMKGGNIQAVNNWGSPQYSLGKYRRWEPVDFADVNTGKGDLEFEPYTTLEKDPIGNRFASSVNYPVLRYSDILLMRAEIENQLSGPTSAVTYLNEVRNRVGLMDIEAVNSSVMDSKANFFLELVKERSRELCFEGVRKGDLIRWELLGERLEFAGDVMASDPKANVANTLGWMRSVVNFDPSKHLSLPYPQQEVEINQSLNQKKAYNGPGNGNLN